MFDHHKRSGSLDEEAEDGDNGSTPRKKTAIEEQWERSGGFELTSVEQETYEKYFYGTEHWNYFTNDEDLGPVILSIKQETLNSRDQFRSDSEVYDFNNGGSVVDLSESQWRQRRAAPTLSPALTLDSEDEDTVQLSKPKESRKRKSAPPASTQPKKKSASTSRGSSQPAATLTPSARKLQFADLFNASDDVATVTERRTAALQSVLWRRVAGGLIKRAEELAGNLFVEVRVYNRDEIAHLDARDRYWKALVNLRYQVDESEPELQALFKFLKSAKAKFTHEVSDNILKINSAFRNRVASYRVVSNNQLAEGSGDEAALTHALPRDYILSLRNYVKQTEIMQIAMGQPNYYLETEYPYQLRGDIEGEEMMQLESNQQSQIMKRKRSRRESRQLSSKSSSYVITDTPQLTRLIKIEIFDLKSDSKKAQVSCQWICEEPIDEILDLTENVIKKISKKISENQF
ncbi:unnamed protein product [Plutella xylostella]|uniref:(diamondback moth) hypothetical protein n=1 Tax=Plutella xylostella TaxID=51655 RepID=A0A8S4DPL8_PLUXY|nr:unnamed protein product [Plutella xylostella]